MNCGSYIPLPSACLGSRVAGRPHATKVASGPNKAASQTHALSDRPRACAMRAAANIDAIDTKTVSIAAIIAQGSVLPVIL
jgi:hypothetical protein